MTSGKVTAMELSGTDAIATWRQLIGPTNTSAAKVQAPNSIRALYGHDQTANAVHGSDCSQNGRVEAEFFFSGNTQFNTIATFSECTLCIVKPTTVANGQTGAIIQHVIDEGFEISAMQMFHLDRQHAIDFLEVYKSVVPEYTSMVDELSSGPCVALEIKGEGADTVERFRQVVGPSDPELARLVRPNTIRARFGSDKIKNAVHCTDLEDDGVLEVEYFFSLLQGNRK